MLDLDIKCYEYPLTHAQWRDASQTAIGAVATFNGNLVGMVMFRKVDCDVEVLRLAVSPLHRRQGLGRRLLWNVILYGRQISAHRVCLVVPERQVSPGSPEDLSGWLTKFRFTAGRTIRDAYYSYGEPEDGVEFSFRCSP